MKNASRHVVFSFGWSLGLSASANIRKLSNINSRRFAEDEAEASASALQPCLHHLKCHNLNKNAIFRGFYP